jgi:hypothetical protein
MVTWSEWVSRETRRPSQRPTVRTDVISEVLDEGLICPNSSAGVGSRRTMWLRRSSPATRHTEGSAEGTLNHNADVATHNAEERSPSDRGR